VGIYLGTQPNPFNLPVPSPGWLKPIADYDPELRIMPSQQSPVYRLMRMARRTGSTNAKVWRDKGVQMAADTQAAFALHLVPITTLTPECVRQPPEHVVQWLKDHDITAHGGADKVVDRMEAVEQKNEQKIDDHNRDEVRQRSRASYIGYQYRTGARVSLVRRIVRHIAGQPLHTPDSASAPVASPEPISVPARPSVPA
jgi:hypothetical protein